MSETIGRAVDERRAKLSAAEERLNMMLAMCDSKIASGEFNIVGKGHWIEDSDPGELTGGHWKCSNCENVFGMPEETMRLHNYCPVCGSRMVDD